MGCHLSARSRSCFPTACARSRMHTGFAGKSKGHLGEGQHDTVLGGEHGGPVPATLTQTAKEMGRVGKRPTPVVTTRCTLRCQKRYRSAHVVRCGSSLVSGNARP